MQAATIHYITQFIRRPPLQRLSDPKWILRGLKSSIGNGVPSSVAVRVTNEPLKGGLIGSMLKLALDWPQGSDTTQVPRSLVVKTVIPTMQMKFMSVLLGNSREAYFYRHFEEHVRSDQKISILPRVYHSEASFTSGEFAIIMEDLSTKAILSGQILGNQCWGPVTIPSDVEHDHVIIIDTIFREVADIHRMFWRDQNLLQHSWLKSVDWLQGRSRHTWEFCLIQAQAKWTKLKNAVHNNKTTVKWSPKLIQLMDHILENSSWEKFRRNFDITKPNTPFTLCHGDFHAGNIMWSTSKTGPKIYLLDWSEVGVFCPFTELAQFIISHATIDLRRKHEKQLFRAYYERLAVPADVFPFEDCWERYKAGGIERWMQMLVMLAMFSLSGMLPESAIQWFHDQVLSFVDDHLDSCKRPLMLMSGYAIPA